MLASLPLAQRRTLAVACIFFAAFMTLEWLPWMIQDQVWPHPGSRQPEWIFWLQTLSGNWAPYENPPVSRWTYAFAAILAVLINNAIGFIAIGLTWRLILEWKQRMKLKQVFASRDQATKQALFQALPSQTAAIQKAYEDGKSKWRDELVILFGQAEAERLQSMLGKEI